MTANGHADPNMGSDNDDFEQNAHQDAYIFSTSHTSVSPNQPPSKRRKVSKPVKPATKTQSPFVPLLDGKEPPDLVHLRFQTFQKIWSQQEQHIQCVLRDSDAAILSQITEFLQNTPFKSDVGKISAGLIVTGPSAISHARLFDQLNQSLDDDNASRLVVVESSEASNLKAALRTLIRSATRGHVRDDVEDVSTGIGKGLPYDLRLLHEYMQDNDIDRLVISFPDIETFDVDTLTELLHILSSWSDRIPIILFFGIAMSVELFEGRLPRSAVRLLQGTPFEIQRTGNILEKILRTSLMEGGVWLGPGICRMLIDRTRDHIQSPEAFVSAVKYAYMSHFFANPLSVLLADNFPTTKSNPDLCEAIRNLPSFRKFAEAELNAGKAKAVRTLLNDDQSLLKTTLAHLRKCQETFRNMMLPIGLIHEVLAIVKPSSKLSWTDTYISALSGTLRDSPTIRDLMLSIRHASPPMLKAVILHLLTNYPFEASSHQEWFDRLITLEMLSHTSSSSFAVQSQTSNKKGGKDICTSITAFFTSSILPKLPSTPITTTTTTTTTTSSSSSAAAAAAAASPLSFPHEIYLASVSSPSNQVFVPKPRAAIERALARPHDYLACDCCDCRDSSGNDHAPQPLSATQPPTAVLWQLLQEGGAVVNIADLRRAFLEIMKGQDVDGDGDGVGDEDGDEYEDGDDDGEQQDDAGAEVEKREKQRTALFYRSLAELKYLGFVRRSGGRGGKGDCLIKGAWNGL